MSFPKQILLFALPLILAILAAIISWKYANFFLSRRDYYVNSQYNLLLKKLGWAISCFFTTWLVATKILVIYLKKTL